MLLLEDIMKRKGITGKYLAEKVGVTAATISNIRKGVSYPKYDLLLSIAKVMDIDVRELFPSTKGKNSEILYIKRDGQYVPVGSLNLEENG